MSKKVQEYKSKRVQGYKRVWTRTLLLFYFCTFVPSAAVAAVTFDAVSTAKCTGCTSVNIPAHVIGGGCTNPILITAVSWDNVGFTVFLNDVTATGGALTFRNSTTDGDSIHILAMSSLAGLTGSQSITATFTGTAFSADIIALSYCGVNQTVPHGTSVVDSGAGTTAMVSVVSDPAELVVDAIFSHTTMTVGAGQTQRVNAIDDVSFYYGASDKTGASTTAMSWSLDLTHYWAMVAIPVRPFTPTGTGTRRRMVVVLQ